MFAGAEPGRTCLRLPPLEGLFAGAEPGRTRLRPPPVQAGLTDPATMMKVRVLQLVTVLAALVSWEVVARAGWVDPLFVPAPSAVARALLRVAGTAVARLGDTLCTAAGAHAP